VSTEFKLLESQSDEVVLVESSCLFSLLVTSNSKPEEVDADRTMLDTERFTPEQIAMAGIRMIQAAAYNMEDAEGFYRTTLKPKLAAALGVRVEIL
jgi:hypothetical protein